MSPELVDNILKWTATAILCVGSYVVSAHPAAYPLGPLILFNGGCVWLIVAIRWKERALIITNGAMCSITIFGFLKYYGYF